MEEENKTKYSNSPTLYLEKVRMENGEKDRVYAVICTHQAISSETEKVQERIEETINKNHLLYPYESIGIKLQVAKFRLIDDKITEAGGERLYLTAASAIEGGKQIRRCKIVRAKSALEAKKASSKSLWLKKDDLDWSVEEVVSLEDIYDIIHVGIIKES